MDPRVVGQQWASFLKQQIALLRDDSSQKVTCDEDQLSSNPFYSKYAEKLKSAKSNQAVHTQQELTSEEKKTKEDLLGFENRLNRKNTTGALLDSDGAQKSTTQGKVERLDDVLKLSLIQDLDRFSIEKIWFDYFKSKESVVFACLNAKNFDLIKENALKNPVFVFLLPVDETTVKIEADLVNKNNYQFVLVQFNDQKSTLQVYFTPLAFFHTHKENAPATLKLNYYTEIKDTKDIVLMHGEYDNKVFNLLEAQCLANQIQIFYSDPDKQNLLSNFTQNPQQFDYMSIVKEFEKSFKI